MSTAFGVLLLLVLCLPAPAASAKDFLRAEGRQIVDASGEPVLLRGFGLGGWMLQEGYMLELSEFGTQRVIRARIAELIGEDGAIAFQQAWLDNHTTKADIDALAAWGFNSVRLPMHYALYTLPVGDEPVAGEQTWLEDGFRRTDELLAWVKANDMYLVLDLHAAPGGQGNDLNISDRDPSKPSLWDDPANQDKMVALWRKLAERYRDEPHVAAYDIINEPNWGFASREDANGCKEDANGPLRELQVRTTAAIREVDTRHIVIVAGNCWGNNYRGVFDAGLWDDNLVVSFHKYWNVTTRDSIAGMLALRDRLDVPLWLGETGENSNDWFARTVALVEREGIGWAWWPLKKIGYNNPLQVLPNEGYRTLQAYWAGKGGKPTAEEAHAALMRFASHDVRFENNAVHADVVDALLRSPHSDRSRPFRDHVVGPAGGRIAAVDFDMGRNGVAYHDLVPSDLHVSDGGDWVAWNPVKAYRNDGVDLGGNADAGYFVASMQEGEWLKYTLRATAPGSFDLALETRGDGRASVELNGRMVDAVSAGDGFRGLELLEGHNTLVLRAETSGFDFHALEFRPTGTR